MSKLKYKLKHLFVLNTIALGAMHTVNQIISSSATVKNILKPDVGKFHHWKLGNIFYRKIGSGSPLLLIHDLNCSSSGFEWSQLEHKLSRNHTVYTIDLLGCGTSDKPGLTYTSYLYVQLISDFIRNVIKEKTDVVVTGLSSSFLTMSAYSDKELIDKIVMINPPSLNKMDQLPDDRSKVILGIMSIPVIGTFIYHIIYCRQNVEYSLTENFLYNPFRVQSKYIDAYYESAHRVSGNGKFLMASIDGQYVNINIRKALHSLDNNILIIYGAKAENKKETAESYHKLNENISTILLSGTKLLPQLEAPEDTFSTIENFLL